ncbi:MAG: lipoate--protein ligase family protein, partial [Desulfurococcaceae archaeon]
ILQHGTLMYATNLDTLEKALLVPTVKLESKGVKSIKERVITLKQVIGDVDLEALIRSLIRGFSRALNAEIYYDQLSEKELELAKQLVNKYRDHAWIFRR